MNGHNLGLALDNQNVDNADRAPAPTAGGSAGGKLSLREFTDWFMEISQQPMWRGKADKEMDYVDGNQLGADILQKMADIGMAPAIEPLIGPAIEAVLGFEAKTRTDWRLQSDTPGPEGDAVAQAFNFKLNQAERKSGADRAMSDAFKPQLCVGLGWVEVARESNPFKFKYRVRHVHRNEIWWDWLSKEPDLSDARYLFRRRWTDADLAAKMFPTYASQIMALAGGHGWFDRTELTHDGGTGTGLAPDAETIRGSTIEEHEWLNTETRRVCLFEVWYRRWEDVVFLTMPDGRVVEYDGDNPLHVVAVAQRIARVGRTIVPKMYVSFWVGPHKVYDGPTPHKHSDFPYVPFWGAREDRTNVPYGRVRGMIFLQDNVNSLLSKLRWGMSAVRTIRTKGAYAGPDEVLRQQVARADADIILDRDHMSQAGAKFEIERDFQLNEQQFQLMQASRDGIQRASGITSSFQGQTGTARSGVQEATQVEQTTQSLADLMDNFKFGRTKVGELLLSMIVEDSIGIEEEVKIPGNGVRPDKTIRLNTPAQDPVTGETMLHPLTGKPLLTNDVERTMMKVALNDVPSTPSFRAQQLQALSEAFKSLPPDIQMVVLPHLLNLMDVPDKDEIIRAVQEARAGGQITEEQVQERIAQALKDNMRDLKERELGMKYDPARVALELQLLGAQVRTMDAKDRQAAAQTLKTHIEAIFGAVQAAEVITAVPQVAEPADLVVDAAGGLPGGGAGTQDLPVPPGQGALSIKPVENKKTGIGFTPGAAEGLPAAGQPGGAAPGDTSPNTPAEPASPFEGATRGIETMRADSAGAAT